MKTNYHFKRETARKHADKQHRNTVCLGQVMRAERAEMSVVIQGKFSSAKLLLIYIVFVLLYIYIHTHTM